MRNKRKVHRKFGRRERTEKKKKKSIHGKTVASSEENAAPGGSGGAAPDSALFSNIRGSLFGGPGSPQRVVSNIRGFLSNRLSNITPPTIPDTGKFLFYFISLSSLSKYYQNLPLTRLHNYCGGQVINRGVIFPEPP